MNEEKGKFYTVWAKHTITVRYEVPEELIKSDGGDGEWEERQLLDLLCNKDIAYVSNQLRWYNGDEIQSVEFDRRYMESKGINVFIEYVDGDPSPTKNERRVADWDIAFPED